MLTCSARSGMTRLKDLSGEMEHIEEVKVRLASGMNIGHGSYVEIEGKILRCIHIHMDQGANSIGTLTLTIPMHRVSINMIDDEEVATAEIGDFSGFQW